MKDRIIPQAIAQQLTPLYEPKFLEGSYGYRSGRSAQDAFLKLRGYAEDGYGWVVLLDLSKYFDTLNQESISQGGFHSKDEILPDHRYFTAMSSRVAEM